MQKLDVKELRIYYDKDGYPKLPVDKDGNVTANFDTSTTLYTSSRIKDTKELRPVFCIEQGQRCLYEEYEVETLGFSIYVYTSFQSDTTNRLPYVNPYEGFLIKKIGQN